MSLFNTGNQGMQGSMSSTFGQPSQSFNSPYTTQPTSGFPGTVGTPPPAVGLGQQQSAFGTAASTSSFGNTAQSGLGAFGQSSAMGARPSTPGFGASSSAFGSQQSSAFGQPSTSTFGQPQQMSTFGQTQQSSAFGQPQQQQSTFGQPQTQSAFGQQQGSSFGQSSAFGSSGASSFGSSMTGSSNTFGQPSSAFGGAQQQSTSAFGARPSTSAFGSSSTSAFGNRPSTGFGSSSSAFGQTQPQQSAFGGSSAFGGQTQQTGAFGQQQSSAFGQPQQQSSAFGMSQPQSAFGGQQTSAFGQPAQQQSAFGQPQGQSAFGQPSGSAFGSQTSAFGQPSGGIGSSAFGGASSAFGQSQQQTSAFGQPTSSFGTQGASPFGSHQPSAFGGQQSSPFGASSSSVAPAPRDVPGCTTLPIEATDAISSMSASASFLFAASWDNNVYIANLATGQINKCINDAPFLSVSVIGNNPNTCAALDGLGRLFVIDGPSGQKNQFGQLPPGAEPIACKSVPNSDAVFLLGTGTKNLSAFSVSAPGNPIINITLDDDKSVAIDVSGDGQSFVVVSESKVFFSKMNNPNINNAPTEARNFYNPTTRSYGAASTNKLKDGEVFTAVALSYDGAIFCITTSSGRGFAVSSDGSNRLGSNMGSKSKIFTFKCWVPGPKQGSNMNAQTGHHINDIISVHLSGYQRFMLGAHYWLKMMSFDPSQCNLKKELSKKTCTALAINNNRIFFACGYDWSQGFDPVEYKDRFNPNTTNPNPGTQPTTVHFFDLNPSDFTSSVQ